MKQTQFDQGQVLKGSFSELNSALRTVGTNVVLKDAYTNFVQVLDSEGRPTEVIYYQGTEAALDSLIFTPDSSQSLAGTYITFEDFITKETTSLYYVVDGNGSAPNVSNFEFDVNISENDTAGTICFATKSVLEGIEKYIVTSKNILSSSLEIEYMSFGESSIIDTTNSPFTVTRLEEGDSIQVGRISLSYDADGNPIYNNNPLKGLTFNPFTGSFEVSQSSGSSGPSLNSATEVEIINFNIAVKDVEESVSIPDGTKKFTLRSRNKLSEIQLSYTQGESNTNFLTLRKGANLSEDNLSLTGKNLYVRSNKDSTILEIMIWK